MYADTSRNCCDERMRFGMVGCEAAVSQTASAAVVIPGVLAISLKLGAVASGDRVWPARTA